MKNVILTFAAIISFLSVNAGVITLEGNYQGTNLYIKNSFSSSGVGFCVTEVKVNGELTTDEWNSSAFEIDFMSRQLNVGDPVKIEIRHRDECATDVKVLNPEAIKAVSTYEIVAINCDRNGNLTWSTINESGELDYIIEQYRWNKWVKAGVIKGTGKKEQSNYSFKITPHSGPNMVRIKQVDHNGPKVSQSVKFRSINPPVQFAPLRVDDEIFFTDMEGNEVATMYEIFDQYGNLILRGYGSKVNVSNLKTGAYHINYDSSVGKFVKK